MDKFQEFEELINNINDKVFKATFQNKEAAVEYLERFVTHLATMLDLDKMTLSDTNFVSEGLEEYFCDVVYETHIKLKRKLKNLVRVILLFEHKKGLKAILTFFYNYWAISLLFGNKTVRKIDSRQLLFLWSLTRAKRL